MSLFDLNDPQSVGLLSLGLRLMSTPGGLGQALGQSGLGAMGDVRATQQASQQQQMAKLAFERAQMERDQAAEAQRRQKLIEQAAIFATRSPQQQALAGGGGPTVENAAKIDPNGYPQMDPQAFVGQLFKQGLPMEAVDYQGKLKKQEADPIKLGANERLLDPKTKGVLVDAMPDAGKKSALAQMISERDSLPVGSPMRAVYDAAIQKQTTHAPAASANVYMGDKELAKQLGGIAAKNVEASQNSAEGAQSSNAAIGAIRAAMNKGGVILGPGAQARQVGKRVGQIIGAGTQESADSLANTKAVEQGLAMIELDAAKLMKGQGQITEAERAIISRAAAGRINELTPQELEVAMKAIERNNNRAISQHQQRLKQLPPEATGGFGGLLNVPGQGGEVNFSDLK